MIDKIIQGFAIHYFKHCNGYYNDNDNKNKNKTKKIEKKHTKQNEIKKPHFKKSDDILIIVYAFAMISTDLNESKMKHRKISKQNKQHFIENVGLCMLQFTFVCLFFSFVFLFLRYFGFFFVCEES